MDLEVIDYVRIAFGVWIGGWIGLLLGYQLGYEHRSPEKMKEAENLSRHKQWGEIDIP